MVKGNYDKWVSESNQDSYFRFEQSIGALEGDPHCLEAASTLFWQIYFERWPDGTDLQTLLNRVDSVLDALRNALEPRDEAKRQSSAFVQLHLVTILLGAIRKHAWGSEELVRDSVDRGKKAFSLLDANAYGGVLVSYSYRRGQEILAEYSRTNLIDSRDSQGSRQNTIDYDEFQQRSCSAVSSLFHFEAFRSATTSLEYQDALINFARGMKLWLEAMGDSLGNPDLSSEYDLQEAANIFERLLSSKSLVNSWQDVSDACSIIVDSLYIDDDNVNPDIDLLDSHEIKWPATNYWTRAATLAELEMSPPLFKQLMEDQRRSQHVIRLENDFFQDYWERLEKSTQKNLVDMEDSWYEGIKRGGSWTGSVADLVLAFQHELNHTVFIKAGYPRVNTPNLNLGDMANLLEAASLGNDLKALSVKQAIESAGISRDDRLFLVSELPPYLRRLWKIRNKLQHEDQELSDNELRRIRDAFVELRSVALGIGEPSHMKRIVYIKGSIR